MTTLNESVRQFVSKQKKIERIIVACSGGLDSMVLLQAVVDSGLCLPVLAVHINHQLSANANAWQHHCEKTFNALGVEYHLEKVEVINKGQGLEQAARQARYRAFASFMQRGDLLLTGHHADDQAETLLLKLGRGAGVRGMSGIAAIKKFPPGLIGRPLLAFDRQQLLGYAQTRNLVWVEDESNVDEAFDRNFIRHSVLPVLKQRWPHFSTSAQRCAQIMGDTESLLNEYARSDLVILEQRQERLGWSIDLSGLVELMPVRRNQVLRFWLQTLGVQAPSNEQFLEFEKFCAARSDQSPVLVWGSVQMRRFKRRLYCLPNRAFESVDGNNGNDIRCTLKMGEKILSLMDGSELECLASEEEGGLPAGEYNIKTRAQIGGDLKAKPHGRRHSQSLKKLMQEYGVEPWLRNRVPLVFKGNDLVAVASYWVESEAFSRQSANTVQLNWRFPYDTTCDIKSGD